MRRVAITGVGAIAGPGRTASEFWNTLLEGRAAIGPLESVAILTRRTSKTAAPISWTVSRSSR